MRRVSGADRCGELGCPTHLDLVVVGDICLDVYVAGRPGDADTEGRGFLSPGGSAANTAVAAAGLGLKTALVSAVGDDFLGSCLVRELCTRGVCTEYVAVARGATPYTVVFLEDGERRMVSVRSGLKPLFTRLPRGRFLHVSGYALIGGLAPWVTRMLDGRWEVVSADLSGLGAGRRVADILKGKVGFWMFNEGEAKVVAGGAGRRELEDFVGEYGGCVVVKRGGRGCSYLCGGRWGGFRAMGGRVVDTTGAGDAFAAAFLYALAKGADVAAACGFANCFAGLKVGRMGAWSLPPARMVSLYCGSFLEK